MASRHKAGSKPYRDDLRASLQALGAHGTRLTELVARDLQQNGARPRQAWRYAAEMSQREAAERFNQITGNPQAPTTANRISDFELWPDGGVRPTVATLHTLANAYGTAWDQLVDARDLHHMPESQRIEYFESSRAFARSALAPPVAVTRRRKGHQDVIAEVADESAEFGEWVGMSEVADATIEQYATQVRRLAQDYDRGAPPFPLLLETRRLRDRVTSRLRGHTRLDQARDLYLVAAQTYGLLAWQTGNLGNYRAADTHAWTAWMCAEQAGHNGARAWVRATQAMLAEYDGRYSESAQLAEDGLSYGTDDSARVMLALFRAKALACTGQQEDAGQALDLAGTELARVFAADLLGGTWSMTPDRYYSNTTGIQVLLGEPARALAEAQQAITLSEAIPLGDRRIWSSLYAYLSAAIAHLQQGNLDGAAASLRPVLDLPADSRRDPIVQRLARIRRLLAQPAFAEAPLARDTQEEIETYHREALPRQITP